MAVMGVCPDCGFKFPLALAVQDTRAREALVAALEMSPKLAGRIIDYLGLFSPSNRAMRMDALANRLDELSTAIGRAEVVRDGQTWAAPLDYWRDALDEMRGKRDTLRLPLKDHNYLFAMVANRAMGAAGKKEAQVEHQRQHYPKGERKGMQKVGKTLKTAEEKAQAKVNMKEVKSQLKRGATS